MQGPTAPEWALPYLWSSSARPFDTARQPHRLGSTTVTLMSHDSRRSLVAHITTSMIEQARNVQVGERRLPCGSCLSCCPSPRLVAA